MTGCTCNSGYKLNYLYYIKVETKKVEIMGMMKRNMNVKLTCIVQCSRFHCPYMMGHVAILSDIKSIFLVTSCTKYMIMSIFIHHNIFMASFRACSRDRRFFVPLTFFN